MPRELRVQNASAGGQLAPCKCPFPGHGSPRPRNPMTFLRRCGGKLTPRPFVMHGFLGEIGPQPLPQRALLRMSKAQQDIASSYCVCHGDSWETGYLETYLQTIILLVDTIRTAVAARAFEPVCAPGKISKTRYVVLVNPGTFKLAWARQCLPFRCRNAPGCRTRT